MGQIVDWVSTGTVAQQNRACGDSPSRAIVRNKAARKRSWVGVPISRLGGGTCWRADHGQCGRAADAAQSAERYRAIFGQEATPELMVYDRGGDSTATRQRLALEGVREVGIQPKGKRPWSVAEGVRDQIRSERGRTEGSIGTLKSQRYKFNKPKDRLWETLAMAGPRSILSFNLNKFMRDVVALTRCGRGSSQRQEARRACSYLRWD